MSTANESLFEPTATEGRRNDAVLVVMQNNEAKNLAIQYINPIAAKLLGYEEESAVGRWLEVVLSSKTAEMLAEEIEYRDDAPDLGDVLARQREIRLRHRLGQEITVACKVSRLVSEGKNACFQLVIPNELENRANQQLKDFIALNLQGHQQLDAVTGLPNHATATEFLPLLKNYLSESKVEATVAVLRMDRHAKSLARYGAAECETLLQHTAACCRNTFRSQDIIFALSDHTLALVLIDISRESARMVLNRLRWNIRSHRIDFGGKADFSITVTVAFDMMEGDRPGDAVLEAGEAAIEAVAADERNGLIELNG